MDVYPVDSILVGAEEFVYTTHVIHQQLFYVHMESRSKILEDIMNKLETRYTHLRPEEKPLLNKGLGSLCAAKFTDDGFWYRAKITGLLKNGHIEVQFVDYGNTVYVTEERIKAIDADLIKYPMQSYRCCLADVSCLQEFWTPEQIIQFKNRVIDRRCRAKFVGENEAEETYLLQMCDNNGNNINQLFGAVNQETNMSVRCSTMFPVRKAPPAVVARQQTAPEVDMEDKPACISHVDTHKRFCVQTMDSDKDLNDVADSLETVDTHDRYYAHIVDSETVLSDGDHPNEVAAGDMCAQFTKDDAWYRARIESCTVGGPWLIDLVDW